MVHRPEGEAEGRERKEEEERRSGGGRGSKSEQESIATKKAWSEERGCNRGRVRGANALQ